MNSEHTRFHLQILFDLIQEELHLSSQKTTALVAPLDPSFLKELYTISKQHDLAHLIADILDQKNLLGSDEISEKFRKQQLLAVYRYQRINHELEQVCSALEAAKIPNLPLKGSIIRNYYPEPWMRTSCDIDILVHETDLDSAILYLCEKLEYKVEGKGSHDVSLISPSCVHIELHFDLVEKEYANGVGVFLSQIWDHTTVKEGLEYGYELSDEMFYFYHLAHMAKHVEYGGCGIRPFLDLWILDHQVKHDQHARDRLLEIGGLLKFAIACRQLSETWFSNTPPIDLTPVFQEYVINGGVYGTFEHRIAVRQHKRGGKIQYVFSRIFLSYDDLKVQYPILQKHRWLMPIMQVCRWFNKIFHRRLKHVFGELKKSQNMTKEHIYTISNLLEELGLENTSKKGTPTDQEPLGVEKDV